MTLYIVALALASLLIVFLQRFRIARAYEWVRGFIVGRQAGSDARIEAQVLTNGDARSARIRHRLLKMFDRERFPLLAAVHQHCLASCEKIGAELETLFAKYPDMIVGTVQRAVHLTLFWLFFAIDSVVSYFALEALLRNDAAAAALAIFAGSALAFFADRGGWFLKSARTVLEAVVLIGLALILVTALLISRTALFFSRLHPTHHPLIAAIVFAVFVTIIFAATIMIAKHADVRWRLRRAERAVEAVKIMYGKRARSFLDRAQTYAGREGELFASYKSGLQAGYLGSALLKLPALNVAIPQPPALDPDDDGGPAGTAALPHPRTPITPLKTPQSEKGAA